MSPSRWEMSPSTWDSPRLAPKSTSRIRNPPGFHAKPNRLFTKLKSKRLYVFFIARFPPDYLSFLTAHEHTMKAMLPSPQRHWCLSRGGRQLRQELQTNFPVFQRIVFTFLIIKLIIKQKREPIPPESRLPTTRSLKVPVKSGERGAGRERRAARLSLRLRIADNARLAEAVNV